MRCDRRRRVVLKKGIFVSFQRSIIVKLFILSLMVHLSAGQSIAQEGTSEPDSIFMEPIEDEDVP